MKTYRIFYIQTSEKYVDIPAPSEDEALEIFDKGDFDRARVHELDDQTETKIVATHSLDFNIFKEIDQLTDHYFRVGGTD